MISKVPIAVIFLIMFSSINLQAQNAEESLAVFPNPMLDKATLQFNSDDNPTEIVVYNIIGKEIHRQKLIGLGQNSKYDVDFSFLNPGIYFLSLLSKNETLATKKIVKKR